MHSTLEYIRVLYCNGTVFVTLSARTYLVHTWYKHKYWYYTTAVVVVLIFSIVLSASLRGSKISSEFFCDYGNAGVADWEARDVKGRIVYINHETKVSRMQDFRLLPVVVPVQEYYYIINRSGVIAHQWYQYHINRILLLYHTVVFATHIKTGCCNRKGGGIV